MYIKTLRTVYTPPFSIKHTYLDPIVMHNSNYPRVREGQLDTPTHYCIAHLCLYEDLLLTHHDQSSGTCVNLQLKVRTTINFCTCSCHFDQALVNSGLLTSLLRKEGLSNFIGARLNWMSNHPALPVDCTGN